MTEIHLSCILNTGNNRRGINRILVANSAYLKDIPSFQPFPCSPSAIHRNSYFCPMFDDAFYMKEALRQAQLAAQEDEVPIGCVIVWKDRIIARAYNRTEQLKDFTAHAEMQAFTSASDYLNNKYLNECTLYVTLEPCVMCSGAAFWTQLGRVVYGATDHKRGVSALSARIFHPLTTVQGGVLETECAAILSDFFRKKREREE